MFSWVYANHGDGAQWVAFGWWTSGWESINSGAPAGSCLRTDSYDWSASYAPANPTDLFDVNARSTKCNLFVLNSAHSVMMVGLGDGSVRGVVSGISKATWLAACMPNSGKALGSDW